MVSRGMYTSLNVSPPLETTREQKMLHCIKMIPFLNIKKMKINVA